MSDVCEEIGKPQLENSLSQKDYYKVWKDDRGFFLIWNCQFYAKI